MIHGNRHYFYLCGHFSWRGSPIIDCPLCSATHHHCLYRTRRGAGSLWIGRGVRHGVGVWSRSRRHHPAPVSTGAGHETDCPVEQPAPINAGRPDQRGSFCGSRLRPEPPVWIQRDGRPTYQCGVGIFVDDNWHQAAANHRITPPSPRRAHDRSTPVSGSPCHHCVGHDRKRGRRAIWPGGPLTAVIDASPAGDCELAECASHSAESHQALRSLSRIYFPVIDWLVSWHGGVSHLDGTLCRDWRLYCGHQHREQPDRPVHRHQPQATPRLLSRGLFLLGWERPRYGTPAAGGAPIARHRGLLAGT